MGALDGGRELPRRISIGPVALTLPAVIGLLLFFIAPFATFAVYSDASKGEALQVAPGDSVATCRLASSLYAQANYKEAMRLLRGMINKGTGAYCAYFTLGVAFADAGIYGCGAA